MSRCVKNRKTLLIAGLVILLCLISVTGASYALFTDSTGDGVIGVNTTSGKLEIDIVEPTGENPESLVGETLGFVTTSGKTEILFEPGATYYTNGFRIMNRGNINCKFIVFISEDSRVEPDFFDGFDVWITDDPHNLDNAVRMNEFEGTLGGGECTGVYYLVFHMKEEADNRYSGRIFEGVGITVSAVQSNGHLD